MWVILSTDHMNDTPYNKDFGSYYYELNDYYNNKGEKGKLMIY